MKCIMTLTWGAETYTPTPYNTYVVGPFSMQIEVDDTQPGRAMELRDAAYEKLKEYAERQRVEKHRSYTQHLKASGGAR